MDTRVGVLLNAQRQRCEKILSENIDAKNKVAAALLELETLSLSDIEKIVGGEYPESKKDSGEYLYKKT